MEWICGEEECDQNRVSKCISGSSEEVGPEWGDGREAGRALRMHVREET